MSIIKLYSHRRLLIAPIEEEFDPLTDLPGGVFGLQASEIIGLSDGNGITEVPNLLDEDHPAVHPTANGAGQPIYKTGIINGLAVIRVAAGQGLEFAFPFLDPPILNSDWTFYWMGSYTRPIAGHGVLYFTSPNHPDNGGESTDAATQLYCDASLGGSNQVGYEWNGDAGGPPTDTNIAASVSGIQVLTWRFEKSVPRCRVYRNGTLLGTGAWTADGASLDSDFAEVFHLSGTNSFIGDHSDFWGFAALHSDTEHTNMVNYLMERAGLS